MKVRFQADADLNAEIVVGVRRREPSVDFQTAEEANLRRFPDPEVLALALSERLQVSLITTDHSEFDSIEQNGRLQFLWLH